MCARVRAFAPPPQSRPSTGKRRSPRGSAPCSRPSAHTHTCSYMQPAWMCDPYHASVHKHPALAQTPRPHSTVALVSSSQGGVRGGSGHSCLGRWGRAWSPTCLAARGERGNPGVFRQLGNLEAHPWPRTLQPELEKPGVTESISPLTSPSGARQGAAAAQRPEVRSQEKLSGATVPADGLGTTEAAHTVKRSSLALRAKPATYLVPVHSRRVSNQRLGSLRLHTEPQTCLCLVFLPSSRPLNPTSTHSGFLLTFMSAPKETAPQPSTPLQLAVCLPVPYLVMLMPHLKLLLAILSLIQDALNLLPISTLRPDSRISSSGKFAAPSGRSGPPTGPRALRSQSAGCSSAQAQSKGLRAEHLSKAMGAGRERLGRPSPTPCNAASAPWPFSPSPLPAGP